MKNVIRFIYIHVFTVVVWIRYSFILVTFLAIRFPVFTVLIFVCIKNYNLLVILDSYVHLRLVFNLTRRSIGLLFYCNCIEEPQQI